jgi:hypothetical protein
MPSADAGRRHRRGLLTAALVVLAGAVAGGCGTAADGGQADGNQAFLADLAGRLNGGATATYTATYTIGGGATGTIAQAQGPDRVAITYPTGITVVTPDGATQCDRGAGGITCAKGASTAAMSAAVERGGMIRPETVTSMLTTIAMDADAIVSERDTSYAGLPATCATVTYTNGSAGFDACVTSTGLLASFNGTVGDAHIDMALNRVVESVADDAFAVPASAKIVSPSPSN